MKKLRLPATLCVLVFLLLPGGIPLPSAAAAVPRQQVIMVLVNRLGYEDLRDAQLPGIRQLAQRGACGLMIVKTAGVPRDPSAYLTIGAGTPAAAPQAAGRNFNAAEEPEPAVSARDVYFRNTGFQAPPEAVVQIAPGVLLESNARLDHPVLPGALGECLRRAGKKTAVIGTSDNKMEQAERWAPLVAMDGRGLVDAGDVGNDLLLADPLAPFGSRTDYARLERRLAALRDRADLIVVETGDLYRLAMVEGEMLPAQAAAARRQALRRVDAFVGRLLPWIDRHTLILLVSPLPPPAALKSGARFTPLIMAGGEIPPGTVLTSASTRTPGVVANFDIAPTVLAHLGLADTTGTMIGAPVAGVAGSAKDVDRAFEALAGSAATRSPLLNAYLRYVQLVVLGSLLWVGRAFWRRYSLGRTAGEPEPGSGKYFLVSLTVLPFVFLLGPLCGSLGLPAATLLYAGLALFLTALLTRIRSHAALFLTLGLFNLGPILVDVVRGSPLMRSAVLGFNPLAGGRFYGIGNEYMGVLLGAALLAGAAFAGWRRERKNLQLVAVLFYAALVYFLAAPNLGANAGGTVAAAAAFGAAVLWPCLGKRKTGWKTWLLLLGVFCLLGMTALVGLNLFLPFEVRSHVARVTELLLSGNLAPVWEILARKAEANWHLLTRSPWGTTLALQLLLLVAILAHSRQEVRRLGEERPLFTGGLAGLGVGALVALLCNDSGVTAACTMLVFLLVPLFWTLFVPGGEDLVSPLAVSATARKS